MKLWPSTTVLVSWLVVAVSLIAAAATRPTRALDTLILDGLRDAAYGAALAADPAGDLANPGPGEWSGTAWSDLTTLYCGADGSNVFIYADLPAYAQSLSSGQIGLSLRRSAAVGNGGSADPWGNAITFAYAELPTYIIRGDIPGIVNPPNGNNGWTELRTWNGSSWSAGGVNWGGIPAGGQLGTKIAYADQAGVELLIPYSDIGLVGEETLLLQFFTTQNGATKGAYDTVPSDDQATGWDDPTTHSVWAVCDLSSGDPTPSVTPDPSITPSATPSATPTPTTPPDGCAGASLGDGVIMPDGLYHLDTDPAYRNPLGAIEPEGSAELRLRSCDHDVQQVQVLVWKTGDPLNAPSFTYDAALVASDGLHATWSVMVPGPGSVIDQWYQFRLVDSANQDYYHPVSGNTGVGTWSDTLQDPSWKLGTMPPPPTPYHVPTWVKDAVIYQIFPDRFRNGDPANDALIDGTQVYGPGGCADYPHDDPNNHDCLHEWRSWNEALLIPSWGFDYYGGDLQGVIDQINAGYFNDLGVNTLYFNPIFEASANHGYDTNDYYAVRSYFGDNATFEALMSAANAHGLRVVLDAVFNHGGQDSRYLDPWGRWPDVGACESATSLFRPWFTPGNAGATVCDGGWGWKGWYNFDTLPEFVDDEAGVRDFFFGGDSPASPAGQSVSQYWLEKGIAGWRYDVAQDISHDFFSQMRPYIKGENDTGALYGNPENLMLGEVTGGCDWYLYQSYLNANELDSVMNYCFRDWANGFGNGNAPSSFDSSYHSFRALFPDPTFYAMMNLISTHDAPRMLHLLNSDKQRLKLVTLLQMTLPGAPSVYYGDEVGVNGGSDPDNRRVYPWADTGGGMNGEPADLDLQAHFQTVLALRRDHAVLRWGDVATALVSDAQNLYAYVRFDNPDLDIWDATQPYQPSGETAVMVLNNGATTQTAVVPVGAYLADGASLTDVLNGGNYSVVEGQVTLSVNGQWGAILIAATTPPITPTPTATATPTATPTPSPTPTATPTPTPTPAPVPVYADHDLYLSLTTSAVVGGLNVADEDILGYDGRLGVWYLVFDGSDVGLATVDLDAFTWLADDSLLLSVDQAVTLPDVGLVDDSDIVQFFPTSWGLNTAGSFALYLDGSAYGLETDGEDIDALDVAADGRLLLSVTGNLAAGVFSAADEDIAALDSGTGTWALTFDGSDVALTTNPEDINGLMLDAAGHIYISTLGSFAVPGASGDGADILVCVPTALGDLTSCTFGLFWDGSLAGLAGRVVDGLVVMAAP